MGIKETGQPDQNFPKRKLDIKGLTPNPFLAAKPIVIINIEPTIAKKSVIKEAFTPFTAPSQKLESGKIGGILRKAAANSEDSNLRLNELLKRKYDLPRTQAVKTAVKRHEKHTGEKVPQNSDIRIQTYFNQFHKIIDREDPIKRERGMRAIKRYLHAEYVIKSDQIPQRYWENQKRMMREQGLEVDMPPYAWKELKKLATEAIVNEQKESLDKWVDYLASKDATYPDALKYLGLRGVLSMGAYDAKNKTYLTRTEETVAPFPELNREALAYALDGIKKKSTNQPLDLSSFDKQKKEAFEKFATSLDFAKLYALANEMSMPMPIEGLANTQGQWIKYEKGSDHKPLVDSLLGKGTGWCTAGETTAQLQLQGGNFYVYYSQDASGKFTIPRAAIRMEYKSIAEVRGIGEDQNLDPYIAPVVAEKLTEFRDGKLYQQKASDMLQLTEIDHKMRAGVSLTGPELAFLYELDHPIQGFGYYGDPRVKELRGKRDPQKDLLTAFNCEPSQIARSGKDITSITKAFVGPLRQGIFDKLARYNIEHIYTTFPEGRIKIGTVTLGDKSPRELEEALKENDIYVYKNFAELMKRPDFITTTEPQTYDLVRLHVGDLGIRSAPHRTLDAIYERAKSFGLSLCTPEVVVKVGLQNLDLSRGNENNIIIATAPFYDSADELAEIFPNDFFLPNFQNLEGLSLALSGRRTGFIWNPDTELVFIRRKENI